MSQAVLVYGNSVVIFGDAVLIGGQAPAAGDTTPPTITSASSTSVSENALLSFSLTANETVTWSIVGGADQIQFEISGSTLRWAGNGTKDYEAPADADHNNVYVVTVRATDTSSNLTDQTISVTVLNLADTTPTPTTDGGDGLTKKELAALKKKLRAASGATTARRLKAEQRLTEALETAWAKVYGPNGEKPAPDVPRQLVGAIEAASDVAADLRGREIAHLRSLIAQGWALVERARELQRQRDEQEEEDDVMLLLAA